MCQVIREPRAVLPGGVLAAIAPIRHHESIDPMEGRIVSDH